MQRRKLREYPNYDYYPFKAAGFEFFERDKAISEPVRQIVHESGEVQTVSEITPGKHIIHDKATYIKVFKEGIELLPNLGKRGITLLCYVLNNLKPGVKEIELIPEEVVGSISSLRGDGYYIGLCELLNYGFLAVKKGRKPVYYINLNYFFNGDRRRTAKATTVSGVQKIARREVSAEQQVFG